jgi:hypothetical protein
MENNQFFAGAPVLSLITNFSDNGGFERIYMVMNHLPQRAASNQMRRPAPQEHNRRTWNGPMTDSSERK